MQAEQPQAVSDLADRRIPLSDIYRMDGFNPRRHFDSQRISSLAESLRKEDVIQPLVVRYRPSDEGGRYHLIAGERRYRAALEAGLVDVPVSVRDVDDAQARRMAMAENDEREDLAPSEEARKAREMVDACEGDRAVAARELNWSRKRLDHRLLLLNATDQVLEALDEGAISLRMAELLAGQPHVTQDGTIGRVIEQGLPISTVKEAINGIAIPLSQAAFSLDECRSCPHNSAVQGSLFSEAIGGEAKCMNRECYQRKTQVALDATRRRMVEEYPVVRMATETSPDHSTILQAEGANGVGRNQLRACRQCPHHGAVLEDRLGSRTGEVREDVCFNLPCWHDKRKANQAANQGGGAGSSRPAGCGRTEQSEARSKAREGATTQAAEARPKAAPKGLHEHINAKAVSQAGEVVGQSEVAALAYAIVGLQHYIRHVGTATVVHDLDERIGNAVGDQQSTSTKQQRGDDGLLERLLRLDQATLADLQSAHAVAAATAVEVNPAHPSSEAAARRARPVLQFSGYGLSDYAPVDQTFLSKLPRKAIEALLEEVGFWDYIDQQGDAKERRKAIKQAKASELPERVMEQGFDWSGCVPALVRDLDPQAHNAHSDNADKE